MTTGESPRPRGSWLASSGYRALPAGLLLGILLLMAVTAGGLDEPVLVFLPVAPALAAIRRDGRAGAWMLGWAAAGLALVGVLEAPADIVDAVTRSGLLLCLGGMGVAAVGSFRDETERLRELLKSASTRDDLTGLANRGALDDRLALEHHRLSRQPDGALSVILLDVDRFQAFNDTHGHQSGNECLQRVADTVSKRVRRATDLLARYGGDELLAVLPATTRGEAAVLAECIRRDVEALGLANQGAPGNLVTVSLGVAAASGDEAGSVDALLTRADAALAESKSAGRNRVTVAP